MRNAIGITAAVENRLHCVQYYDSYQIQVFMLMQEFIGVSGKLKIIA
jgi:hypothetical protein